MIINTIYFSWWKDQNEARSADRSGDVRGCFRSVGSYCSAPPRGSSAAAETDEKESQELQVAGREQSILCCCRGSGARVAREVTGTSPPAMEQ